MDIYLFIVFFNNMCSPNILLIKFTYEGYIVIKQVLLNTNQYQTLQTHNIDKYLQAPSQAKARAVLVFGCIPPPPKRS